MVRANAELDKYKKQLKEAKESAKKAQGKNQEKKRKIEALEKENEEVKRLKRTQDKELTKLKKTESEHLKEVFALSEQIVELTGKLDKLSEGKEQSKCVVCLSRSPQMLLIPCMHINMCNECVEKTEDCPTCRCSIKFSKKVFVV